MAGVQVIQQDLLKGTNIPTSIEWSSLEDRTASDANSYFRSREPVVGIAVLLNYDGSLNSLAIAIRNRVFLVRSKACNTDNTDYWLSNMFSPSHRTICAFGMARIALHVKKRFNVEVLGADIISSALNAKNAIKSPGLFFTHFKNVLTARQYEIDDLWNTVVLAKCNTPSEADLKTVCLRAWLSTIAGSLACIPRPTMVNTKGISKKIFDVLHHMAVEIEQLDASKPRERTADFRSIKSQGNTHQMVNNRYNTRARHSEKGRVVIFDKDNNSYHGRTVGHEGKRTTLETSKSIGCSIITRALFKGKEELTLAEHAKEVHLLKLLQGLATNDSTFAQRIWFQADQRNVSAKIESVRPWGKLNQSQANVVEAMVSGDDPIVVVHGPPGTGKTSTISVAVQQWVAARNAVWLVAQSNVGVKNIAEKLCKDNIAFRLLVSKEFHFEWHEHIYEGRIRDNLIRTDEFPDEYRHTVQLFKGIQVVLCTLSTLSNTSLVQAGVFRIVPVHNLVVDEASQIGVFEYLHLFAQFKDLKKACFFGDPMQLPPYGLEASPNLQCIFDIKHLQQRSYFLDTQYRMPTPIGEFISSHVYGSRLKSQHHERSSSCLALVDAGFGSVEEKSGTSWMNAREIQAIIHLVRNYYQTKNFCIITPYDAQRGKLQDALRRERLPWENVFNVDSFQGNEADFVLISVVRTTGPGFMKSVNRVNVMLTRCKAGMVIVTNPGFLTHSSVKKTLLGKLAMHWVKQNGKKETWRTWQEVASRKALLPALTSNTLPLRYAFEEAVGSIGHSSMSELERELAWRTPLLSYF